ncbi:hypothetical protein H6G81_30330 [Scytonema hofmannii FACHB-248]|uniref:Uncharacterized protein n=1 Tax=Scytonema hofmannii FACHB-248 TaxID=1842502 RepID=A0ABR8H118_9CYAN|nr:MULTISPECIES: hypothetical protein [Nostocales]MBD2608698.1 hypothetical protein [Scytonema hofmannii FACHB-248]
MNSQFSENPDKTIALENFSVNQQFTGNHHNSDRPEMCVFFCSSSCLLYDSSCSIPDAIDIDLHISGHWALGNGHWAMGIGQW